MDETAEASTSGRACPGSPSTSGPRKLPRLKLDSPELSVARVAPAPPLPAELVWIIVDFVWHAFPPGKAKPALCKIARIARIWRAPAQYIIFQHITIRTRNDLMRVAYSLRSSKTTGCLVRLISFRLLDSGIVSQRNLVYLYNLCSALVRLKLVGDYHTVEELLWSLPGSRASQHITSLELVFLQSPRPDDLSRRPFLRIAEFPSLQKWFISAPDSITMCGFCESSKLYLKHLSLGSLRKNHYRTDAFAWFAKLVDSSRLKTCSAPLRRLADHLNTALRVGKSLKQLHLLDVLHEDIPDKVIAYTNSPVLRRLTISTASSADSTCIKGKPLQTLLEALAPPGNKMPALEIVILDFPFDQFNSSRWIWKTFLCWAGRTSLREVRRYDPDDSKVVQTWRKKGSAASPAWKLHNEERMR